MPDCKYADDKLAIKYSNAPSYVEANRAAIFEMLEQVGHLEIDENGLAKKGLLIRHLVLPGEVENSKKVLDFIAHDISCDTYISLMSQYHKAYRAAEFENLNRKLKHSEYEQVLEHADKLGLQNGWRQEV
jgi:putative pyruvate formate lyase activating enzyme